ncbi:MAG: flagellar hook-basal body complex protein [Planctomycetes bacterium]|nr:flagellar hook-basal body complex protein [Planctomycetota bacterium]
MASNVAMFTGLSGLAANARNLEVIGNNIANVNTIAFKSNRMIFSPTFSRNFSLGTSPGDSTGGTNPGQIGLGVSIAGTQRNFNNGSISATGVATDVAIEGDGFLIVDKAGERFFTRAGSLQRNAVNDLVTISGARVMGFAVDEQFDIIVGNLVPLNIPVGTLTLAESTKEVRFNGNVNPSGVVATTGSVHTSKAFFTDPGLGGGTEMDGTLDLTNPAFSLYVDDGVGGSSVVIEGGAQAIITVSGVEKGGKDLGSHTFGFMTSAQAAAAGVDDFGTTMNDYLVFLDQVLGIDGTTINSQTLGGSVTINNVTGQLVIKGNEGTVQDLAFDISDQAVTYAGVPVGTPLSQPFSMSKANAADGESVRTSFIVYDSLGTATTVDLTFVLQATIPGSGSIWEFVAESSDNDALDRVVGLGVVTFDSSGRFVSATNQSFSLVRGNGATSPLSVSMSFDDGTDAITALTDTTSVLAAVFQDGSPIGTLSGFSIGEDGTISGSFTNGLTRNIGQLALAKFSNPEGLVDSGNNLFRAGPNSGTALITSPLEFGTGRLIGGALELSNVDLSQEFINLILASTGYSASSRIITTTNDLIQQLLVLGR